MRARNIKPGFFKNEKLADLPILARLLFIGLWAAADREGRLEDRPKRLKIEIFPYDEIPAASIHEALQQLHDAGFILRYESAELRCIQIVNWHKHQSPHYMEVPSEIEPPPGYANHFNHTPVRKEQRERILKRDGHACVKCGATQDLTVDHITPISQGGTSDDTNLRTLCGACNNSRPKRRSTVNRSSIDDQPTKPASSRELKPPDSLNPDSLNPEWSAPANTSVVVGRPLPQQPPALRVALAEVPKTAAAIRKRFTTADAGFVVSVAYAATQVWIGASHPKIPCPDDADIADAIQQALADTQHRGPGLLLTTVPAVIDTWCQYGRQPPAITPQAERLASNLRRMHARA